MDITVGICTWNRAESLRQTLDALTRLRLPPSRSWEVLVVNNNCSDHTDDVIRSFAGRLPLRRLHEPQPGKSLALNHAIREATGTYVLWTDDDVLVEPDWMAALVDGFERFQADWVFGRSRPLWVGGAPPWYSERFGGYFAVLDYGSEPRVITDRHEGFYGLNCAGTLIAHRHLGGFRAEFGFRGSRGGIGEDTDIFERALAAGMRIVYTPDAVVNHAIEPMRTRKTYHLRRHWVANEVVYQHLDELYPGMRWALGLPRFFYSKAIADVGRYLGAVAGGNRSEAFHLQLQLVRFAKLVVEAGRHGFRSPRTRPLPEATR